MLLGVVRSLLLALALLVPHAMGNDPDPAQPVAAFAAQSGNDIWVSWVPGIQPVDYFVVYGIAAGVEVPLGNTTEAAALVDSGFPAYGVASVTNGVQSKITPAVSIALPRCTVMFASLNPPAVYVGCNGIAHVAPISLP